MNDAEYELELADVRERYEVRAFHGYEALNAPYRFQVTFGAFDTTVDPEHLVGSNVCVTVMRRSHTRRFPGIVERAFVGDDTDRTVTLTCVPALQMLSLQTDTRIFQDLAVPEILRAVLEPALRRHERTLNLEGLDLTGYLTRNYCVQYRETNLDFVHRLMEEEGIGYHFDVCDEHEVLTLFDEVSALPPVPTADAGPVQYLLGEDDGEREHIVRFEREQRSVSRGVAIQDWDWTRGRPLLRAEAGEAADLYEHGYGSGVTSYEDGAHLAVFGRIAESARMLPRVAREVNAVIQDLRGAPLPPFTSHDTQDKASMRSELATRDRLRWSGSSQLIGLQAGAVLELQGHPDVDGAFYVTSVEHGSPAEVGASTQDIYANRFKCLPCETPWRPDRVTRKPRIYGAQTATVTGPAGLDVHTDPHGRIRVRFGWDRRDDDATGQTSCWIRVSQPWAGSGGPGVLFLPRVGMEVVVTFLDGDPDRPLATGTVYAGGAPTPTLLPLQATKSVIRTRSIPHGIGYNELSFEDASGSERVFLRAQRDFDEHVLASHSTRVDGRQSNHVAGDHDENIGGHSKTSVGRDHRLVVHGERFEHVMGDTHEIVEGAVHQRVELGVTATSEQGGFLLQSLEGDTILRAKRRVLLNQDQQNFVGLGSEGVQVASERQVSLEAGSATVDVGGGAVEVGAGEAALAVEDGAIRLTLGESTLSVVDGAIEMTVGGMTLRVSAGSITANGKVVS